MASETEAVRSVARQEPDAAVGVVAAEIAVGQCNAELTGANSVAVFRPR